MRLPLITFCLIIFFSSCDRFHKEKENTRKMVDSIGFATTGKQMDSIMVRINRDFEVQLKNIGGFYDSSVCWKVAISPHDDYTYASYLYPAVFKNVKADVLFLIGVFHKARYFDTYDVIVLGNHTSWAGPYGKTKVSGYNKEIINSLPDSVFTVSDTMMEVEHSLEAFLPFIQYYNPETEIVPMIIPYMKRCNMKDYSRQLAEIIAGIAKDNDWEWGKDFAIVISNDAVHYGDDGWGGKDFAYYGTDVSGYHMAVDHEKEIIDSCLNGELMEDKIIKFIGYTTEKDNYKEYKWTWCGRYSIPFGLYTAWHLQKQFENGTIEGNFIGYANSIDHQKLIVEDLGMGVTAPANDHHWVGYAVVGYR